jgi:riboflavin kinase/FMN adenylyltransferase
MKVLRSLADLPHGYPHPIATIGNFDGMHLGHQKLMRDLVERAVLIGATPTVVTFYPHPLQVLAPDNAPRQIQSLQQKLAVLESLGIQLVIVIPFNHRLAQTSARDFGTKILVEQLQLEEIYVGPNFAFGHRREGSFNLLKEIGADRGFHVGKIHQIQFRGSRVSSTAVRQALVAGQVALARRMLGRPFSLEGEIAHGTATGAELGIQTANLRTSNEIIPRNGVYATILTVEGKGYKGVTNIGIRPTITGGARDAPVSIETHVLDFHRDIYGKAVTLEFLLRLRSEQRFSDRDALIARIRRDIERARRYFRWWRNIAPVAGQEDVGGVACRLA